MPKKKSGARKKKEKASKNKLASQDGRVDFGSFPSNESMECGDCGTRQRNRAFCYLCGAVQRLFQCGSCGRIKCPASQGDCVVKHSKTVSGLAMAGAVCDFCETFICHSRRCLSTHACECPFRESPAEGSSPVRCIECERNAWEHGGRVFHCSVCDEILCQDDHFEHQASCLTMEGESNHCVSCGRVGQWACMHCKVQYCDIHVKSAFYKPKKGTVPPCKKCQRPCADASSLSLSTKSHAYGRQRADDDDSSGGYYAWMDSSSGGQSSAGYLDYDDDDDDVVEEEDEATGDY